MSAVKFFKAENRLAKALVAKGGMNAQEAIALAQVAVDEVHEPTLAEIDADLDLICRLGGELKAGDGEALKQIYGASNRIVATAGIFDLSELGQAAYSLCELVSRFEALSRFNAAMVRVHMEGMRLLRQPQDHSQAHRQQVLSGLRQVTASLC